MSGQTFPHNPILPMIPYSDLITGLKRGAKGRLETVIPEDWMQGRTTYGGLTAALSHEAARELAEGRPVRSVQIAFVGPVGGEVVVSPSLLRAGRAASFVNVDVVTEKGVMARALFVFGEARPSTISLSALTAPEAPAPEGLQRFFPPQGGPNFARHFEVQHAGGPGPLAGAETADVRMWLRHRDEAARAGPVDATNLLSLADVPPPAAMSLFRAPGPLSSMSWMAEFLTDAPATQAGWWLSRSVAETAADGYSSQAMTLWSRDGTPVMAGRQTVAIFV